MRKTRSELPQNVDSVAPHFFLDSVIQSSSIESEMAKKNPKLPVKVSFTPRPEDIEILTQGQRKHGVTRTAILQMALRRFAEAEGMKAS